MPPAYSMNSWAVCKRSTAGKGTQPWKLPVDKCRLEIMCPFLPVRVISHWNNSPSAMVEPPSLPILKPRLDVFLRELLQQLSWASSLACHRIPALHPGPGIYEIKLHTPEPAHQAATIAPQLPPHRGSCTPACVDRPIPSLPPLWSCAPDHAQPAWRSLGSRSSEKDPLCGQSHAKDHMLLLSTPGDQKQTKAPTLHQETPVLGQSPLRTSH